MGRRKNGSSSETKLITGLHCASMMFVSKLLYHDSISRSTKITFASGYASTSSSANATAGGSALTAL
jgi:hypothetical protein